MRLVKRFFPLFLIVLLVLGTFLPFISAQKTDFYELSVEVVGRNVLFVNEQVSLKTVSNASQVLVQIFDRLNVTQYSKYVDGNSTFAWLPPAVYGLFTVKASIGEQVCTTWFWLQDTRGLSAAPSTSVWGWQGLTCNLATAVSAGKVSTYNFQVAKENATFETEWLSEVFSKLKPTEYSMEANAAGCVHIKTYSAKNQIDSWVMNTWFGVKIRVNGTLEKPTTFKWALKAVSGNVLWQVGGLRVPTGSGNLVYDWSDMDSRSTGVSYVLDKTGLKLDVYLQSSFDLDPTLFSDGFESGDFSAWTGTTGTPTVSTTRKHHGDYALFVDAQESVYYDFTATNTMFGRCYVNFNAFPASDAYHVGVLGFDLAGVHGFPLVAGVEQDPADSVDKWYLKDSGRGSKVYGTTPNLNQWYCLELEFVKGGTGTLSIDGAPVLTRLCYDLQTDRFIVGTLEGSDGSVYMDCCVVADAYIGPEATGTNYNIDLSMATAMTYTLSSQWQAKNDLTWQTPETYTLTKQWNTKTTIALSTPLSWTTTSQTAYNLALPFTQSFTWLLHLSVTHTGVLYAVDLLWSTPQTWTMQAWTGLSYILTLAWTSGFTWTIDFLNVPLSALDVLGVAAFALIIGLTALGVAALVMLKRRET
jgi:hypothetical protein